MSEQFNIKMTADELRAVLYVLKSTPIDMGLYPLFINLQAQLKDIVGTPTEDSQA